MHTLEKYFNKCLRQLVRIQELGRAESAADYIRPSTKFTVKLSMVNKTAKDL